MSRTVNDLDKNAEALQTGLLKLFSAVGLVIGSLIMMFRFHVGLTMIFLVFMAFSLFSTKLFSAKTLGVCRQKAAVCQPGYQTGRGGLQRQEYYQSFYPGREQFPGYASGDGRTGPGN